MTEPCSCSCHDPSASPRPTSINSAAEAYRHLRSRLVHRRVEIFVVVPLNVKMVPIARPMIVGQGSVTSCLVHPRETFAPAVRKNAFAVLLAHNHPSGDPEPSDEDAALTKRMVAAGDVIGIRVMDHIIVCRAGYYSFADAGRLVRP